MVVSELREWVHELEKTMNFPSTANKVFQRLILGEGPGLLVLWGGLPSEPKKANKTYFLNTVKVFQKGPAAAKQFASSEFWALVAPLKAGHYQCVSVVEDCASSSSKIYETPMAVAVPMALAWAAHRRGLAAGRNLVILCDNIDQFMEHNMQSNEKFLRELAIVLDGQKVITFLGASRKTWDAEQVLGLGRALALGWD